MSNARDGKALNEMWSVLGGLSPLPLNCDADWKSASDKIAHGIHETCGGSDYAPLAEINALRELARHFKIKGDSYAGVPQLVGTRA
jgi:hypothetical protein